MMTPKDLMEKLTLKVKSTRTVQEIASKMQEACTQFNFSILQTYNFYDIIESKGFHIDRKVFVFEICQAKMASKILNNNPDFSIFLPCKIAVYENDGTTEISTINMEMMLKLLENDQQLYIEATTLFNSIKEIIYSLQ